MGEVVRLGREHYEAIYAFLATSPIENVLLIDRLLEEGLPGRPYQEFVGYREGDRWLGVMYFAGDISIFAPEAIAVPPLAFYALRRIPLIPRIISRKETVDLFWETFGVLPLPMVFDRQQRVYTLSPEQFSGPHEPLLRMARLDEALQVAQLASAMSFEEIQLDPLKDFPASYLRGVEDRIREGRYFVLEQEGEIRFQVHLSAITPQAGQVTGVYTVPKYRGQGYGLRGLSEFCRQSFAMLPQLCLFVNDFNKPAIALYEHLGFKHVMDYRAIFLEQAH